MHLTTVTIIFSECDSVLLYKVFPQTKITKIIIKCKLDKFDKNINKKIINY